MIYLDNAATTFPKPQIVWDTVDEFNRTVAVNAVRGTYKAAREAAEIVFEVRTKLTKLCNATSKALPVLAPSATVALNQIIHGFRWKEGMNVYVSPYEHNSVARPLHLISKRYRVNMVVLPLNKDLTIDILKTKELFKQAPPSFVALSAISNVTGYRLPFEEIFSAVKEYRAFCLLDAAQAMGLIPIDFAESLADAIVFAGHKTLYATFGIAGFMLKYGSMIDELIVGGNGITSTVLDMPTGNSQERLEAGSMNTPALCALNVSLDWIQKENPCKKEEEMTEYLLKRLEEVPNIIIYKSGEETPKSIVSFNIRELNCGLVGGFLDKYYDICIRAGHHCAPFIHEALNNEKHGGAIRVSIGAFTKLSDIDSLIDGLKEISTNPDKYSTVESFYLC